MGRSAYHGAVAILLITAICAAILGAPAAAPASSLRFFGHGGSAGDNFVFPDRVKIPNTPTSVSANLGVTDFTIEFWMRATAAENPAPAIPCGPGIAWVNGNILIDRDRFNQPRKFGIALLGGSIAWGVSSDNGYTLCGTTSVLDDQWHHVAVQRRRADGVLTIWVDGALDATSPPSTPDLDVSYPDSPGPGNFCSSEGGSGSSSCINSDPFLVLGAEKHGFDGINYSGHLDEIRLSTSLRYTANFAVPTQEFADDAETVALYHFDEASGSTLGDASAGANTGVIFFGGTAPAGPVWSGESPFAVSVPAMGDGLRVGLALCLLAGLATGKRRDVRR